MIGKHPQNSIHVVVDARGTVGHCQRMQTKHVVHVTVDNKNIRVESDSFMGVIDELNKAIGNNWKVMGEMEHMVVLGE